MNDSVNDPLTGCVTLNVPMPWYGPVPPVAETTQSNGLPAVIAADDDPQLTLDPKSGVKGKSVDLAGRRIIKKTITVNDSVNDPLTDCVTLSEPMPWYGP